jgi:hypothetical protein
MCNLYSITTNQAAISALFRVVNPGSTPPPASPTTSFWRSSPPIFPTEKAVRLLGISISGLAAAAN